LTTRTALPDPTLLAFTIAFTLLALRSILRPDPLIRGLLWTVPASVLALDAAARGEVHTIQLFTGAMILIICTIESSFVMAYRDGLTGLPSRRAFNEELLRLGASYTVAMVDIDHFKRCNDRYGHDVGDQVLRMVATRLGAIGGGGRVFRYGGEEFVVLFPGKGRAACLPHLEEIRGVIGDTAFRLRDLGRPRRKPKSARGARTPTRSIKVTVSIGVAEKSPRHKDPEEVIKAADKALYRAKRQGRNRVVA
jgi:diguanylate cyclase (GGDEF)-like protein